jgi:adenylate cyclase
MAGIIGSRKFAYDRWGDTVHLAHQLDSQAEAAQIYISTAMADILADEFELTDLGVISIPNRGDEGIFRLERHQ